MLEKQYPEDLIKYVCETYEFNIDQSIEKLNDHYIGEFKDRIEFGKKYLMSEGIILPEEYECYFNFDSYVEDILECDVFEFKNHYIISIS